MFWKLKNETDFAATACSPESIGRLDFWVAENSTANNLAKAISPKWALKLARERLSSFQVTMSNHEKCSVGKSRGVILTLDIVEGDGSIQRNLWKRGLYLAIGSPQPLIEVLFVAYPMAFQFLYNFIRACFFSNHPDFAENGKLVRKIVDELETALHRKLEYRQCMIKKMWNIEWYRVGTFPNFFIPDFEVYDVDYTIGWGAILTQPAGLKIALERWSRAMPGTDNILFLVIPENLSQKTRKICAEFSIINKEIMQYDEYGGVDRPRQ